MTHLDHRLEMFATVFFVLAVLHTFTCGFFQRLANRWPEGSLQENLFHLLGEVEVVFGLWAGVFTFVGVLTVGLGPIVEYLEGLSFSEPLFVFAVMTVSATRPVLSMTRAFVLQIARFPPLGFSQSVFFCCLVLGPLLGSLITEPAAMIVTAILLRDFYFSSRLFPAKLKYLTLGVLLVNVSIGGVLTNFAAPPVLMVAAKWNWDTSFMLVTFGWRAVLAVVVNALVLSLYASRILSLIPIEDVETSKQIETQQIEKERRLRTPYWLTATHFTFLALIVLAVHHPVIFMGLACLFLGVTKMTEEYQDKHKTREALLIAFFLAGLVVFGGLQRWWLEPVLLSLQASSLYFGATVLTAVTDNAALTYLGAQVPGISDDFRYALVAGAMTGGGLTVIANAPNPIAFSTLRDHFDEGAISALHLVLGALIPTFVTIVAFWFL